MPLSITSKEYKIVNCYLYWFLLSVHVLFTYEGQICQQKKKKKEVIILTHGV